MSRLCVTHHICDCNMERLLKLEKDNAKLLLDLDGRKEAYSHLDDINIRLNFEIIRLKDVVASFNASPKTISSDIQKAFNREHSRAEKLQLENKVLKEQLKLAESQIDDLKQQVDELNKAVYQENGED